MPLINLSSKGLNKIKNQFYENNFSFIINNKEEFLCPKLLADFVSPIIFKLHISDPTLKFINLKLENYFNNNFNKFLNLIYGEEVEFKEEEKDFLFEICKKLGNNEILNNFINQLPQNISTDNVINIILEKKKIEVSFEKEILFLAENFYKFSENELKILNLEIYKELISNKLLKLEDENKLFNFVFNLINEKGSNYLILLNNIKIQYLEKENLKKYINLIEKNNLILIFWEELKNFILNNNNFEKLQRFIDLKEKIFFNGNNFDGIFNNLKKKI